jgi:2-succinyl-5-enolpyruvyl-6-hydroxy-3-cyclohexene-1-carboxylate synthase
MTLQHLSTTALASLDDAGTGNRQVLSVSSSPADVQATFCATLLDEWVRAGVTRAVVSPGSRSTPMALAIAADQRLEMHIVVDERSASFFALGMAKSSGLPVILLCTSGTAAVEYHPAVVEADLDHVPLIVCTADRPKELHGIGAPQTVDQQHLYGRSVRLFLDLPVAEFVVCSTWRSTAARIVLASSCGPLGAGPVHVNLGFREPLVGEAATLPAGRTNGAPWHDSSGVSPMLDQVSLLALAKRLDRRRGVIVAGAACGEPEVIHTLAAKLGWPVLADARSGARTAGVRTLVANADSILRNELWAEQHQVEVVLRLGAPWASKVVNQWLAHVPDDVLVDPSFAWLDPNRVNAFHVPADPTLLCRALHSVFDNLENHEVISRANASVDISEGGPLSVGSRLAEGVGGGVAEARNEGGDRLNLDAQGGDWLAAWSEADAAASNVLAEHLDTSEVHNTSTISEPALARALVRGLPEGAALVVSSSMPIRDVEWFGGEHGNLRILANRGANGIDGVLSTAFGVAAVHPGQTVCLIGDLAFLHDVGALSIAAQKRINATVVIVDNRGGGIFEFLPQATAVARDRFELLYGTEQNVNLADVAHGFGLPITKAATIGEVLGAVNNPPSGVQVVIVQTNRVANVEVHRALNAEIVERVDRTAVRT